MANHSFSDLSSEKKEGRKEVRTATAAAAAKQLLYILSVAIDTI